jgi:hypothetical protein
MPLPLLRDRDELTDALLAVHDDHVGQPIVRHLDRVRLEDAGLSEDLKCSEVPLPGHLRAPVIPSDEGRIDFRRDHLGGLWFQTGCRRSQVRRTAIVHA